MGTHETCFEPHIRGEPLAPTFLCPRSTLKLWHSPRVSQRKIALSAPALASCFPVESNLSVYTAAWCPVSNIVGAKRLDDLGIFSFSTKARAACVSTRNRFSSFPSSPSTFLLDITIRSSASVDILRVGESLVQSFTGEPDSCCRRLTDHFSHKLYGVENYMEISSSISPLCVQLVCELYVSRSASRSCPSACFTTVVHVHQDRISPVARLSCSQRSTIL